MIIGYAFSWGKWVCVCVVYNYVLLLKISLEFINKFLTLTYTGFPLE